MRVAREAVRGAAASFARFSAFAGSDLARLPAPLAAAARYLREHYDMRNHTRTGVPHTAGIGDEFVDWFAIAGPPEVARERFASASAGSPRWASTSATSFPARPACRARWRWGRSSVWPGR